MKWSACEDRISISIHLPTYLPSPTESRNGEAKSRVIILHSGWGIHLVQSTCDLQYALASAYAYENFLAFICLFGWLFIGGQAGLGRGVLGWKLGRGLT